MSKRRQHPVRWDEDALRGLAFLAAVNHSSIAAEARAAVDDRLRRFGLGLADGQVVPVQAIWEAERRDAQRAAGEATGPG